MGNLQDILDREGRFPGKSTSAVPLSVPTIHWTTQHPFQWCPDSSPRGGSRALPCWFPPWGLCLSTRASTALYHLFLCCLVFWVLCFAPEESAYIIKFLCIKYHMFKFYLLDNTLSKWLGFIRSSILFYFLIIFSYDIQWHLMGYTAICFCRRVPHGHNLRNTWSKHRLFCCADGSNMKLKTQEKRDRNKIKNRAPRAETKMILFQN